MTTRRTLDNLALLAGMFARFGVALDVMTQITVEAEARPQWAFMQSRMDDLDRRIGQLCTDAQVLAFYRHGFYPIGVPPLKPRGAEPRIITMGGDAAVDVA